MFNHKISKPEKLKAVKDVLEGNNSISSIARKYHVLWKTVRIWIRNYNTMGSEAFGTNTWTKRTSEAKQAIVAEYLSKKYSQNDICKKHKIKSSTTLENWIKKYNSHEKLKVSGNGAYKIMTKGRKPTFDERVEIVQYCIANTHDYNGTAVKYKISYQQARNYTVKYEARGVEGLKDNRGKKKNFNDMTELERLRTENRILRAEKKQAEMEASFLKKLEEIERRRGLI